MPATPPFAAKQAVRNNSELHSPTPHYFTPHALGDSLTSRNTTAAVTCTLPASPATCHGSRCSPLACAPPAPRRPSRRRRPATVEQPGGRRAAAAQPSPARASIQPWQCCCCASSMRSNEEQHRQEIVRHHLTWVLLCWLNMSVEPLEKSQLWTPLHH